MIWLEKSIHENISEGKVHNQELLEIVEHWLNERHIESDTHDRKEEWTLEEEKAHVKQEPVHDVNMNLSPEDVAKFIIGTYGYEFASLIANEIKIIARENTSAEPVITMPVL
ncbi:hypothetical protein KKG72_06255 [bacterium]|nr:hypothetical protein [bacterium]MBU1993929.1 hypothetical protein [bacterium]